MRKLFILTLMIGVTTLASAQYRSGGGGSVSDKIYFGGNFGLSIGTEVTNVSVSPLVGYRITDDFSAGVSVTYQYLKYQDIDESFNSTGGSVFSRYLFTDEVFAHAEYEILGYDRVTLNLSNNEVTSVRETNNSLFLGAGYRQDAGRSASFFILGLYDVLWKNAEESLYPIPYQIRAGFAVGF